ncbi:MAG: hypothetical protein AAF587_16260 [Bacteroidota bacterium]
MTTLPLQTLLIQLEQEGFRFDPSEQIRIQRVLHELGHEYRDRPELLGRILSPLIAKTPEEQRRFYFVFEQYISELQQPLEVAELDESIPSEKEVSKKMNRMRRWIYPSAILLILSLVWGWKYSGKWFDDYVADKEAHEIEMGEFGESGDEFSASNPEDIDDFVASYFSDPEHLNLEAVDIQMLGQAIPGQLVTARLLDKSSKRGLNLPSTYQIYWYLNHDSLGEGKQINLPIEHEGLSHLEAHVYNVKGIDTDKIPVTRQLAAWATFELNFLAKQGGTGMQHYHEQELSELSEQQLAIKIQVFLLAILLIFGIEGFLYRVRKRWFELPLKREFRERDQGPYDLPFPDETPELKAEEALLDLAQGMQNPLTGKRQELDVHNTLYSTVRSGGFPSLQFKNRSQVPEYMVLIDESGPSSAQSGLFEQLMRLLQEEGVAIHLWTFRNDPRLCYYPQGKEMSLDALATRLGAHRLIVFSKGTGMMDPTTRGLAYWVERSFASWEERILLTPEPVESWSIREDALKTYFRLLPADMATQEGLLEALMEEDHPDFELLQGELLVRRQAESPIEEVDLDDPEEMQDFLGDVLFEWVAATAVLPEPSWEMTLHIGKALQEREQARVPVGIQGNDAIHIGREGNLISYPNLLKLTQLPFFKQGEMSELLREELLDRLDPETERLAREAVIEILDQMAVPEDSQAYQKKQIEKLVQQQALNPSDKTLQRKMNFLWKKGLLDQKYASAAQVNESGTILGKVFTKDIPWALIAIFFSPLLIGSWFNYKAEQYSNERLFEQYFQPLKLAEGAYAEEEWAELYRSGESGSLIAISEVKSDNISHPHSIVRRLLYVNAYLSDGKPEIFSSQTGLLSIFTSHSNQNSDLAQVHDWYLFLSVLAGNKHGELRDYMLDSILQNPDHLYYAEARSLHKKLNSFWRLGQE